MWYQLFKTIVFVPYVSLMCRPTVVGRENIPRVGGAILAANHLDAGDTFLVPTIVERRMVFPAKAELFRGDKGIRSKVVATFLKAVGQVPLDRTGGRASAEGLAPACAVLDEGAFIGIFPEGTRSPDGRLYRGRTGVARIALATGAPIVPVGLVNTVLKRNRFGIPVMRGARVHFGEPIHVEATTDPTAAQLRETTNRVMAAIQALTGQEYVDVYGSRVKYGDLKGADLTPWLRDRPDAPEPPQEDTDA